MWDMLMFSLASQNHSCTNRGASDLQHGDPVSHQATPLSCRYESKLAAEREVSVRLQGENGLMRNKFASIMAELNRLKAEVATLNTAKQDLLQVRKNTLQQPWRWRMPAATASAANFKRQGERRSPIGKRCPCQQHKHCEWCSTAHCCATLTA